MKYILILLLIIITFPVYSQKINKHKKSTKTIASKALISEKFKIADGSSFGIPFTKYSISSIKNPYNDTLEFSYGARILALIPPHESSKIYIKDEDFVYTRLRSNLEYQKQPQPDKGFFMETKEKQRPKIDIQYFNKKVLDSIYKNKDSIYCRITIVSNYPGDLICSFSGPIIFKHISPFVYDIYLNLFNSKKDFEKWKKGKEEPYFVDFIIFVRDKYCPYHFLSKIVQVKFNNW